LKCQARHEFERPADRENGDDNQSHPWPVGPHGPHLYVENWSHPERTDPDGRDLHGRCGAAMSHCPVAPAALRRSLR